MTEQKGVVLERPILNFVNSLVVFLLVYAIVSAIFEVLADGNLNEVTMIVKRLTQLGLFVGFICFLHTRNKVSFNYFKPIKIKALLLSIAFTVCIIIFYENSVQIIIDYLSKNQVNALDSEVILLDMFKYPLPVLIQTCVTAPIAEEILIRGYLYNTLVSKYSIKYSIIICTLVFSILHFDYVNTIFYFMLGILFSLIYIKTKSIIYCILLHSLINFSSVMSYYLNITPFENGISITALILSGIGMIVIIAGGFFRANE